MTARHLNAAVDAAVQAAPRPVQAQGLARARPRVNAALPRVGAALPRSGARGLCGYHGDPPAIHAGIEPWQKARVRRRADTAAAGSAQSETHEDEQ